MNTFLRAITGTLTNDPYWVTDEGQERFFAWKKTDSVRTDVGFKVKYTVTAFVTKVDEDEYKAARMLEQANRDKLIDDWYNESFLPQFRALECHFRYTIHTYALQPSLCRIVTEGNERFIYWVPGIFDEIAYRNATYRKNGCEVKLASFEVVRNDEKVIMENYSMMMKLGSVDAIKNSEEFRKHEESFLISLLETQLKLEQEFQHIQTNQEHKSKSIAIKTRLVGRAIEITWKFESNAGSGCILRVYRKEEGFATKDQSLAANGVCVIDTKCDGNSIQHLQEGREYFFTFVLTKEEPVYADESLGDSVRAIVGSPKVKRVETKTVDSLRFAMRAPTQIEQMRVERLLEKLQERPTEIKDSSQEKADFAFKELQAFVEFDESMSTLERTFIDRIRSKKYSKEVEDAKIDRLKALVESMVVR